MTRTIRAAKRNKWLRRRFSRKHRNPVARELLEKGPKESSINNKRRKIREKEDIKIMREYE